MASMPVSKTAHAGSNPASPASIEKTGTQIITGVSVFFVTNNLLFLMYVLVQKSTFWNI